MAIAQALLPPRTSADAASDFAASLYQHSFLALPSYYQQEVVGALVTHVGATVPAETDTALQTLARMAEADPLRLQPFAIFIKSLFDGVEAFTCGQARLLYSILSSLGFRCGQQSALREELHILVRKQLGHASPFYRSLGVIGAVAMLQYLMASGESQDSAGTSLPASGLSSASSAPAPPSGANREVIRLLRLVRSSYSQLPALGSLFMDEVFALLARNVLDPSVEAWMADSIVRDFQNDFIVDNALPEDEGENGTAWCLKFALDRDSVCSIAVNLGPLCKSPAASGSPDSRRHVNPLCLASHFRLLCFTERRSEASSQGSLGDIDGLLGAPIILPSDYERRPPVLALLANWLIETLNGFCRLDGEEMRAKLLWRLGHLVEVRQRLLEAIASLNGAAQAPGQLGGNQALPWHSLPRVIFEAGSDWTLEGSAVRVVKKATVVGATK